jgi:hypothetical protein
MSVDRERYKFELPLCGLLLWIPALGSPALFIVAVAAARHQQLGRVVHELRDCKARLRHAHSPLRYPLGSFLLHPLDYRVLNG